MTRPSSSLKRIACFSILLATAFWTHTAFGSCTASLLKLSIDSSGRFLRAAAFETDAEHAKDALYRALNALADAESSSAECGCKDAQAAFETAVSYTRMAATADGAHETRENVREATQHFDVAERKARSCIRAMP